MAGTFKFELVSPERVLVSENATEAIVPGAAGQFTVLAGHAPMISALRSVTMIIKLASGERRVFIRGGIAEVEPDSLTILAQHLIDLDDAGRGSHVDAEIKAAEAVLASSKDDQERMEAGDAIAQLRAV